MAGALIVIDVETVERSIPSNNNLMSEIESIGTPTFPTSPNDLLLSESRPSWVGKSNATERPV